MLFRTVWLLAIVCFGGELFAESHVFTPGNEPLARLTVQTTDARRGTAPIELELTVPALNLTRESDGSSHVEVPGLATHEIAGNPELYTAGSLIAVPPGTEPQLTIVEEEEHAVAGVRVRPAQLQFRCEGMRSFAFNSSLYSADATYPAEKAKLEEVGKIQSVRLVRIGMYPVRFNPVRQSVSVSSRLKVRVDFKGTAGPIVVSPSIESLVRAVVANGRSIEIQSQNQPETMVAVVADALWEASRPLWDWERQKGVSVFAVRYSETGGSPVELKRYLTKLYEQSRTKPTHLLFIGDEKSLPPSKLPVTTSTTQYASGDLDYAQLGGSDILPDVLVGRLLADREDEVKTQIERWIHHEEEAEPETKRGTTIASDQSQPGGPTDEGYAEIIQKILLGHGYHHVDPFYQAKTTATAKNISAALEEGRNWLTYFGHGSPTGWANTNTPFEVSTVRSLEAADDLPVLIDVACNTGAYTWTHTPFAKAWVTHERGGKAAGALAVYAPTVSISWHPPALMATGIAKAAYEKGLRSLGAAALAGQLYLIEQQGPTDGSFDNLRWYTLFGNPATRVP